jgi:hypothetical protein
VQESKGKILVETGTSRGGDKNFIGDGGSTIIFSDFSAKNNCSFYSVDINRSYLLEAKNACKKIGKKTFFIESDSLIFLKNFKYSIDFLELRSEEFELHDKDLIFSPCQDSWIFQSPIKNYFCDIQLGILGCDPSIAYYAYCAGLKVYNPCKSIITYHLHQSNVRTYHNLNNYKGQHPFVELKLCDLYTKKFKNRNLNP